MLQVICLPSLIWSHALRLLICFCFASFCRKWFVLVVLLQKRASSVLSSAPLTGFSLRLLLYRQWRWYFVRYTYPLSSFSRRFFLDLFPVFVVVCKAQEERRQTVPPPQTKMPVLGSPDASAGTVRAEKLADESGLKGGGGGQEDQKLDEME